MHGKILNKFREVEDLIKNVGQIKSTNCYKIRMLKFLEKYPVLKNSTLSSSYFQNLFKAIKIVFKNNRNSIYIDNKTNKMITYHYCF